MKRKILLIDESLTVQKVVSLTLDRTRYQLIFAKSRADVMKAALENTPDVILLSDQIVELPYASFPKELETWVGAVREVPPCILITAQEIKEQRHYAGVLKKPFTPQTLTSLVAEVIRQRGLPPASTASKGGNDNFSKGQQLEDERLENMFNHSFADEAKLVRETYQDELETAEPTLTQPFIRPGDERESWQQKGAQSLWGGESNKNPTNQVPQAASQVADSLWGERETAGENLKVEEKLQGQNLEEVVEKVLNRIVPSIVEKLVQERLDKLLNEQDQFMDLKT